MEFLFALNLLIDVIRRNRHGIIYRLIFPLLRAICMPQAGMDRNILILFDLLAFRKDRNERSLWAISPTKSDGRI